MAEHVITIRRNVGDPDEIHMRVQVNNLQYKRILELKKAEKLTLTEAFDKMKAEEKELFAS